MSDKSCLIYAVRKVDRPFITGAISSFTESSQQLGGSVV